MAKTRKHVSGGTNDVRGVDLVEIERLLAFMQKHGLEELEYEAAGVRVRLKRAAAPTGGAFRSAPAEVSAAPVAHVHPPVQVPSPVAVATTHGEAAPASDLHLIKSPIVGTFYSAPSPDADAFVTRGTRVEVGQVLCIIEAMKLMNEIESDVAGEIAEIYAQNSTPVEYGQPLFGIRLQGKK
jgi:acetyl-CoA carboxylase biotin carboxyl carrier protein